MKELAFASIEKIREALRKKTVSPRELIQLYADRCTQHKQLNCTLEVFDIDSVLKDLPAYDESMPLWGIPGLVKDVICQKDRISSCASKMLEGFTSPYDATAVERLKTAGALSMGRANCDEFAMGSSNETSAYGPVKNPWNMTCVPGGSSGGSAAAVAAGLVPWALGTETGGSIRQPANWCNIVGLKPTYGRVSRYGLIAYASSLDQIGPMTRTVYDNALVFSAIAGRDLRDSTTCDCGPIDYTKNLSKQLPQGLKIGVVDNALDAEGIDPEVRKLLDDALVQYEKMGAQIVHLRLPMMDHAAAVYFVVSRAEAASNLARFDGVRYGHRAKDAATLSEMYAQSRAEGFGHIVKQRIMIGNYVLSAGFADQYYNSAKKVQALLRAQILEAFKSVDVLFAPVSPTPAFGLGSFTDNTFMLDLQDYFTAAANLAHIPALALPCGFTKAQMPIGFQLMGPDLSEELLFQAAYAYEQSTPWHTMHPAL